MTEQLTPPSIILQHSIPGDNQFPFRVQLNCTGCSHYFEGSSIRLCRGTEPATPIPSYTPEATATTFSMTRKGQAPVFKYLIYVLSAYGNGNQEFLCTNPYIQDSLSCQFSTPARTPK